MSMYNVCMSNYGKFINAKIVMASITPGTKIVNVVILCIFNNSLQLNFSPTLVGHANFTFLCTNSEMSFKHTCKQCQNNLFSRSVTCVIYFSYHFLLHCSIIIEW